MRSHSVDSFVVESVKDEQLPKEIPGFALGAAFVLRLLEQCPSVITPPESNQDTLPFSDSNPYEYKDTDEIDLAQPTSRHQRSFEVRHPELDHPWRDEFGHSYSSINLKGNNFSKPGILESSTAADGLIAYGLQESAVIRRVLRASRILRTSGVSTEYILGLAEPKKFPWPIIEETGFVEPLPLAEYKRRLVEQHWRQLPEAERTAEAWVELSSKFERMTFFVSARAMDTSYRLKDLIYDRSIREPLFIYADEQVLKDSEEKIGDSPGSLAKYLKQVFVPNASSNLARLHSLGLAHRFPNGMNVTALGSIVDLDSVHGTALDLGDEPVTSTDFARDLLMLLADLQEAEYETRIFAERGESLISQFIKQYFESLGIYNSPEADSFMIIGNIVRAAESLINSDDEEDDIFGSLPRVLLGHLQKVYSTFFIVDLKTDKIYSLWKETILPSFLPYIAESVEKEVPLYSQLLLDESINEIADPSFDVAKNFIKNPTQYGIVLGCLVADATLRAELLLSQYYKVQLLQSQAADEETSQKVERSAVLANYLVLQPEWQDFLDGWAPNFINELLPKLSAAFEKACYIERAEPLFPNHKPVPLTHTSPNRFLMETTGVSIAEVLELIKTTNAEVSFEAAVPNGDSEECLYEVTDEDSIITEIISDETLDGVTSDGEITIKGFDYPEPAGDYILFVEQKADGTKRLRVHIKDVSVIEDIKNGQDALLALRAKYIDPQKLFDASSYKRIDKPELNWTLVPEIT